MTSGDEETSNKIRRETTRPYEIQTFVDFFSISSATKPRRNVPGRFRDDKTGPDKRPQR